MREMKISKASLLTMWSIFTVASLWLMFFSVSAIESQNTESSIQLHFDPNNAVQHFQGVKIIATEDSDDSYAIIKKNGWLVWIETDYNFLMSGWDTDSNTIEETVRTSTILWWKDNEIKNAWQSDTILWWESNVISGGESNSILWWEGNVVGQVSGSTVFWWEENKIKWNYSSIAWWEWNEVNGSYAAAVWNNNKVDWYNSVAMWSGSKVSGKNSFLWTDGNSSDALQKDNVFVVKWKNGMVVNKNKAHSFAQLTIWGSLIIYSGDTAPECGASTKWVVKAINNWDKKCLCSCDGSWWNAIHDGVMCPFLCSNTQPEDAVCGTGNRVCTTNSYTYTWTCKTWTVVQWEWAFFVSTEKVWNNFVNYINWSCQSDTWAVKSCRTKLDNDWCANIHQNETYQCEWNTNFGDNAHIYEGSDEGLTESIQRKLYNKENVGDNKCAYVCDTGYIVNGQRCEYCPDWYLDEFGRCLNSSVCKEPERPLYNPDDSLCYPYWTCVKDWQYYDINSIQNIEENLNDIVPHWIENLNIRCVDADDPDWWSVEKNSCSYSCKEWYYCNGYTCQEPYCPSIKNRGNNYIYIKNPGHHKFGGSFTMVYSSLEPRNNWEYATSGDFYRVYGEKSSDTWWCYFRCEEKYRKYDNKGRYSCHKFECATSYFFWDFGKYTWTPQGLSVSWNYKNYPTDFNTAKQENNPCIRTCKSWIKITGYRPINITSDDISKWESLLISSSNSKFCYNECNKDNREYLSGDGMCYVCPNNKILTWLAIGKVSSKTYSEYVICQDACPDQKIWNPKYGCIDDCEEWTEWSNKQKKCVSKCKASEEWNSTKQKCVPRCGDWEKWENNKCVSKCASWQTWQNWACVWIPEAAGCTTGTYNSDDGMCYSCADDDKKLDDNWKCICKDNTKTLDDKDNCVNKVWQLELNISNTDSQGNTKIYHNWDTLQFKVIVTNAWNLKIKSIKSSAYYLSGNKSITIKTSEFDWLSVWSSYDYTWTYIFKTWDFNNVATNKTWNFTIRLTATWKVMDDYVKDLNVNSPTLPVTIGKS